MSAWTDTPSVSPSGTHLTSSSMLVSGEARNMLQHCLPALVLETVVMNFLKGLLLMAFVIVFLNIRTIHLKNLTFTVVVENPLISNKDPEKEERFCPTTPR